jgi:hypothetical protein
VRVVVVGCGGETRVEGKRTRKGELGQPPEFPGTKDGSRHASGKREKDEERQLEEGGMADGGWQRGLGEVKGKREVQKSEE